MKKNHLLALFMAFSSLFSISALSPDEASAYHKKVTYACLGAGTLWAGVALWRNYSNFTQENPHATFREYLTSLWNNVYENKATLTKRAALVGLVACAGHGLIWYNTVQEKPLESSAENDSALDLPGPLAGSGAKADSLRRNEEFFADLSRQIDPKSEVFKTHKPVFYVADVKGIMQQPDGVSCGFYAAGFKKKFDEVQSFDEFVAGVVGKKAHDEFSVVLDQWREKIFGARRINRDDTTFNSRDLSTDEIYSLCDAGQNGPKLPPEQCEQLQAFGWKPTRPEGQAVPLDSQQLVGRTPEELALALQLLTIAPPESADQSRASTAATEALSPLSHSSALNLEDSYTTERLKLFTENPFVKECRVLHTPGHYVSLAVIQVPFGPAPHERLRVYIPLNSLRGCGDYWLRQQIIKSEKSFFERNFGSAALAGEQPRPPSLKEAFDRYGKTMAPEHQVLIQGILKNLDV